MTNPAVKHEHYKGHPVICLPVGDEGEFRFGQRKAQAILAHRATVTHFAAGGCLPENNPARVEDFKGQPVLVLPLENTGEFRFGLRKAQAICLHLEAVSAFAAEAAPAPRQDQPASPSARKAATFRKLADGMRGQIAEKHRPAFEGQRSTVRRERFRAAKAEEARLLESVQDKLYALAQAWEQETVPASLSGLSTKAQVERLVRYATFPQGMANADTLAHLVEDTRGKRGLTQARRTAQGILRRRESWFVRLYGLDEIQAVEALLKVVPASQQDYQLRHFRDGYSPYASLLKAGIPDAAAYAQARSDLLALGDPQAGQKTQADRIADTERQLVGLKIPGFFPTTPPVVRRMLALAEVKPGQRVWEPSAGKGDIADGLRASCPQARIEVCEIQGRLREILKLKGYTLVGDDCLALDAGEGYDRVIMNPPFENNQDIRHVRHAYGQLKPGGRLVAAMGEGTFFRQDRATCDFRSWLEALGGTHERLPEGSFKASGTGVAARLVVLDKPEEAPVVSGVESSVETGAAYVQLALF